MLSKQIPARSGRVYFLLATLHANGRTCRAPGLNPSISTKKIVFSIDNLTDSYHDADNLC